MYLEGKKLLLLNIAINLGTFIQILDTSIANVAVPYIAGSLSVSADQGTWVITSFAASNAIVLPLSGWLSNYFGQVRLFVWSVLLFSLVSFLCGLATSLTTLIVLRVVQGTVAGSLIPLSQGLLMSNNPPEKRGSALGFWAMVVVVAPILGPIIGGYLTDVYSWPWIFYINVPIGLISATIVWIFLKEHESRIVRNPIDWVGLFFLALGVGCLQVMLDKGKDLDWFESTTIIALTVISLVSLLYFGIWNYFHPFPLIDFSFFKKRNFILGTVAITVGYLIYFGSTVTVPLWLQTEQNYNAFWAGVAVAPVGIAPFVLSTFVGKNMHRFDLRRIASLSFFLFALSFIYQMQFTTQVSLIQIMWARFFQGFGVAFFFLPLVQIALGDIPPERYTSASGLFNFIRILVGSGFGTSLSIQLWTRLEIFHHARLTEALTTYAPLTRNFYQKMLSKSAHFPSAVVDRVLDRQVEQQAYMLATNDLSYLAIILFFLMMFLVFLCKKVAPATSAKGQTLH